MQCVWVWGGVGVWQEGLISLPLPSKDTCLDQSFASDGCGTPSPTTRPCWSFLGCCGLTKACTSLEPLCPKAGSALRQSQIGHLFHVGTSWLLFSENHMSLQGSGPDSYARIYCITPAGDRENNRLESTGHLP